MFTPVDNPSCSKCSLARLSFNSSRTCGTVRYVTARPLKGDSDSRGPASRTRFLQRGFDSGIAMTDDGGVFAAKNFNSPDQEEIRSDK